MICVSESEHAQSRDARITPLRWLKAGLPVMAVSLVVASVVYALLFQVLMVNDTQTP